jgi:hypothetical protein
MRLFEYQFARVDEALLYFDCNEQLKGGRCVVYNVKNQDCYIMPHSQSVLKFMPYTAFVKEYDEAEIAKGLRFIQEKYIDMPIEN